MTALAEPEEPFETVEIGFGPWHAVAPEAFRTVCGHRIPPGTERFTWDDAMTGTNICANCRRIMAREAR